VVFLKEIPKLGTGKTDYRSLDAWFKQEHPSTG
jgi:hypothetical protein